MNSTIRLAFTLMLTVPLAAQQYTISQPTGAATFGARSTGQTFTPGVGISPALGSQTTLPLTQITLWHGNFTSAIPSTTTFLKIYDGNPNGAGGFVGVSTNSVDTTGGSFHDQFDWSFAQLSLDVSTEYWAVMSSTNSSTSIDVAEVSLESAGSNAYTGGAGLIANIVPHPSSNDSKFRVEFFTGVLASFTVSGSGCPSSVGLSTISASALPVLGTIFDVDFANVSPAGLSYAIVGYTATSWQGNPLPYPLANLIPGTDPSCMLLVDFVSALPLSVTGSTGTVSIAIPAVPSLAGLPLHIQGTQIEPAFGISVTEKAHAVVGN